MTEISAVTQNTESNMKLNRTKIQLCTAGTSKTELANATKALRSAGDEIKTVITALCEGAEEDQKTKLNAAVSKMATMLAGLPDVEKAESDAELANAWQTVAGTSQAIVTDLQATIKASADKLNLLKASIPTEVANAIAAKITSGELVAKDVMTQKITDATTTATTAARASAVTELKRVTDRKLELTTASIPVPTEDVLSSEDAAYATKKTAAEKRSKELAPFKLAPERVLALAWNTDEPAYVAYFNDLKAVYATAGGKPGAANPFGNRSGAENTPAVSKTMLC